MSTTMKHKADFHYAGAEIVCDKDSGQASQCISALLHGSNVVCISSAAGRRRSCMACTHRVGGQPDMYMPS